MILKKKIAGVNAASIQRFVLRARKAVHLNGTVDVLVSSSSEMRLLNARFRHKNKPTDVLSFPSPEGASLAGEIAISAEIALENARRLSHSPADEVKVLVLHGILHLAGYDHERDNGKMARKEASLRQVLNLPESLTERVNRCPRNGSGLRPANRRSRGSQRTG